MTALSPPPPSRLLRLLQWVDSRPKLAALLLALVCAYPLVLTAQFFSDVRAGFTELLPSDAPAVGAINSIQKRLGSQTRLVVIVESPDGEANRRFIRELGQRLEARKLPEAKLIQIGCHEECEWARKRIALLLPTDKFDEAIGEAEKAVNRAKLEANPLFLDLEDSSPPDAKELESRLEREIAANDRFPTGFFETPGGKRVVMMIQLAGSETEFDPAQRLLTAVQNEVAAMRPSYPKDQVVAFNGELANLIEEHDAIVADIALSSLVVFLLVGAVILIYFRSLRGLATALFALAPGLIFTFAIGRLTVHHLNSNTAFLGSIIAGNGINFPLLVLAYFRARPRDEARPHAVLNASKQAFFGTLAASLAASAAYGGLAISNFKGFSQFGWIGGLGMITTWAFTMISMPIAIALFNPPRSTGQSKTQKFVLAFFSRKRLPALVAGGFVLLALVGGSFGVRYALKHGVYETDLQGLRNRDSLRHGSASWDARLAEVMGIWLNPVAALVEDPADREPLAEGLRKQMVEGPAGRLAERVETVDQWVKPLAEQQRRIEKLKKLAKVVQAVPREQIPEKARPWLDRLFAPESLVPVTVADLPGALKANFTEVDGRTDRVVLLFPSLKINYNDSRNVLTFVDELQKVKRPDDAVIGGGFLFMAEIIRLVHEEGPRIIFVVALLVALVLSPLLIRKPLRILLVVGTVGVVALLAQANLLAVGVQLNMLDFAALPITIGIGSDYVVNLLGAMDAYQTDARRACARMGGAIFLCSLTTTIGYASLLMAQSGALRSFGWAAICGEVMAAAAVLLVLPVLLGRRLDPAAAPVAEPTVGSEAKAA
ncbi:MAG: superfamily protein [Myxococcaceae bacterium]|nr:superfamily protein [Myxococcaceae bacterium]